MRNKSIDLSVFIEQSNKIHNFKYDYSKVEYKNLKTKVTIICPIHGEFEQPAGNHLNGFSCKMCYADKSINKHKYNFIERSNKIYNFKYDYSKIKYINMKTDINVICPAHGVFTIKPEDHLRGKSCSYCKKDEILCSDDFIKKVKKIHDDYIYDKTIYKTLKTEVIVGCPTHGYFSIKANKLLSGSLCPQCSNLLKINNDKERFIDTSNKIHNFKYDYSKVEYKDTKFKVTIICPIHGEFEQSPNNHLFGHGCQKCGIDDRTYTTEEFIDTSNKIHNFKYDYSKVEYKPNQKVTIICPIHGEFEQSPGNHISGAGCLLCAKDKNAGLVYKGTRTILYYIYLPEYDLYKIGVTKKDPYKRFSYEIKNGLQIEVIFTKVFENGEDAYKLEQQIILDYKKFKYNGSKILQAGNTELFTENILKLNKE